MKNRIETIMAVKKSLKESKGCLNTLVTCPCLNTQADDCPFIHHMNNYPSCKLFVISLSGGERTKIVEREIIRYYLGKIDD